MVAFPCSKINLGLNIVRRRSDGYHDLQTIMVRTGWSDILEIIPSESDKTTLNVTGRAIDCPPDKNLVMKALKAVEEYTGSEVPTVDIYLRKIVPDGAGLGGGSADAATMVKLLNNRFNLNLNNRQMIEICSRIGADCPFFIAEAPMLCTGTGTTLTPVSLPRLADKFLVIVKPDVSVSTAEAYAGVSPSGVELDYDTFAQSPVEEWRDLFHNDFEDSIFPAHPILSEIKDSLYNSGAVYAAMSGSGSAIFGIFNNDILADVMKPLQQYGDIWSGKLF